MAVDIMVRITSNKMSNFHFLQIIKIFFQITSSFDDRNKRKYWKKACSLFSIGGDIDQSGSFSVI